MAGLLKSLQMRRKHELSGDIALCKSVESVCAGQCGTGDGSGKERASGESVHERMNSGGVVLEIHKTALEESLGFFQGCF